LLFLFTHKKQMLRTFGVPYYAKQPRKAVSVYEDYGPKSEPIKKVRFESVVLPKKKRKKRKK